MTTFTVTLHDEDAAHVVHAARKRGISTDSVLSDVVSMYFSTERIGDRANRAGRTSSADDGDSVDGLWFIPEPDGTLAMSDIAANFDEDLAKSFPSSLREANAPSSTTDGKSGTDSTTPSDRTDL